MNTSERIRQLSQEGVPTAQVAKLLGIRYQHAYNVLKNSGFAAVKRQRIASIHSRSITTPKPPLHASLLISNGFAPAGNWQVSDDGVLHCQQELPPAPGVYAFAKNGEVVYVGVATKGLAKRLYFYSKPGPRQATNLRLNLLIKNEISAGSSIEILIATPPDHHWNGLPIHGCAGLELGLIKKYSLIWNIRR